MTKYTIYFCFVTTFLVLLIQQARSQNNTEDATTSQTTITSFNLEDSTVAETIAPTESETVTIARTTVTENNSSDITTKNTDSNTTENNSSNTLFDTDTTPDESSNSEDGECGCNEHLGYLCGCGERCPIPGIFGPGPACPEYCLEQLTCVCNYGYGRDDVTNQCVACPTFDDEYFK